MIEPRFLKTLILIGFVGVIGLLSCNPSITPEEENLPELSFARELQEAIERKLIGDLKNVVSLTIADKTRRDPKTMKRRQDALEALQQKEYCPVCAENLLQFVGDLLRKEE